MTQDNFAAAYNSGYTVTVRFLASRGIQPDHAEEIAQAAWSKGWERREQLRDPKRIVTWVNSIAVNMFRNECRNPAKDALPIDLPAPRLSTVAAIDAKRSLDRCTDTERDMLEQFYFLGFNSQEIARRSGCTPSAVRVRLLRARRRLGLAMRPQKPIRSDRRAAAA